MQTLFKNLFNSMNFFKSCFKQSNIPCAIAFPMEGESGCLEVSKNKFFYNICMVFGDLK